MTMTASPMRSFLSVPFAGIVTFALFWAMASLIAISSGPQVTAPSSPAIEFIRLQKEDSPIKTKTPPQKMVPPAQPPVPPMETISHTPGAQTIGIPVPSMDQEVAIKREGLGVGSDGDVMPISTVAPQYPRKALSRGIEGWVQISFTISKFGTVVNPRVVDADPTRIFDRAALKAIAQWKYKPKIENGVAVERHDMNTVISFELDK